MYTLLKKPYCHPSAKTSPLFFSRKISISTKQFEFPLKEQSEHKGKLINVTCSSPSKPSTVVKDLNEELIELHPNSLFIWTIPTRRLEKEYNGIYPGHIFSSITDEKGETISWMSKRPNKNHILEKRIRVMDSRFMTLSEEIYAFAPQYTTIQDEFEKWAKSSYASQKKLEHPLYVHIIPFLPGFLINKSMYIQNVMNIIHSGFAYTLHSSKRPHDSRFIRADNCISATIEACFAHNKPNSLNAQDMFCQEAVQHIVSPFISESAKYARCVEAAGLNLQIEHSNIEDEEYRCFIG